MMSLGLQPSVSPVPSNGLFVQSRDSETIPARSFGEVLKVEEKKLQQEQETNALSVAAMFATIQPPAMPESIPGLDVSVESGTTKPAAQTALIADSAKSAKPLPQQGAPLNSTAELPQRTAAPGNVAAKIQANPSMPITETAKTGTHAAHSDQASSLQQQMPLPGMGSVPSTKKVDTKTNAAASDVLPTGEHQMTIAETKDRTASPVTGNQQPAPANNKIALTAMLTTDIGNTSEKTGVRIAAHVKESNSTSKQPSSIVNPAQIRSVDEIKMVDKSKTIEKQQAELTQPETEIVEKTKTSTIPKVTPETTHMTEKPEKQNISQTVPPAAPTREVPRPAGKTNIPTAKVVSPDAIGQSENVPTIGTSKKTSATEMNMSVPAQMNAHAVEISHPEEKANTPISKMISSNIANATSVIEKKVEAQQKSFDTEIKSFESAEVKVPANAVPHFAEAAQPLAKPVSQVEDSHTIETILKNKDGRAVTPLGEENATDEGRLGTASRPKVSNEPFVFVQNNVPASIQSKTVAQSARVEIKSDEKVLSKEVDRKSVLDLESTVVGAGTDKGIVGVKAAEKSSVAQIDPTAIDVIQQITSQMRARIKSGETSIRMQLNPKELGAIEVQMIHNAQGVSVSFITEQASTGQLLESHVSQLRQSLKDAGVQLTNLNISQHHQPNQEGGSFKQGRTFAQHPRREASQAETVSDERMRPQRIGGLTSEIDYLI